MKFSPLARFVTKLMMPPA
ncbi:hypothetical protein D030_2048A, partial [Vibrio parahaemolyticus AQ3810]